MVRFIIIKISLNKYIYARVNEQTNEQVIQNNIHMKLVRTNESRRYEGTFVRTKVRRYEGTKVRRYERRYEGTKVRNKKLQKVQYTYSTLLNLKPS